MSNELIVFEAAEKVGSAVGSLINFYRETRTFGRLQKAAVSQAIRLWEAECRSRAVSELNRCNIAQIAETLQYIQENHLQGEALDYAMEMLKIQHQKLLNEYKKF